MKKITFLIGIIALIITGLGVYSCQKIEENNKQDIQEGRVLTNEQIELIGVKHNEYLEFILKNNRFAENKFKGLLVQKQLLEERYLDKTNKIQKKSLYSKAESTNIFTGHSQEIKENLSSENNFIYFQKVLDFLKTKSRNKSVKEISNFINSIKNEMIKNNVNVRDYEAFLVFGSVLKKSSEFWLPKKLGGQDNYAFYKDNLVLKKFDIQANSEDGEWKDCLADVLEADAISAAQDFALATLVSAGSGGTLTPAALLSVAITSGASSAWAYYRSSNC